MTSTLKYVLIFFLFLFHYGCENKVCILEEKNNAGICLVAKDTITANTCMLWQKSNILFHHKNRQNQQNKNILVCGLPLQDLRKLAYTLVHSLNFIESTPPLWALLSYSFLFYTFLCMNVCKYTSAYVYRYTVSTWMSVDSRG